MPGLPRDPSLNGALAFAREGYAFIPSRCRRLGADAFETRLGLERAVCVHGEEAARMFYASPITRDGGIPPPILTLLQDRGSVQVLDGEAHRHRKAMFLSVTGGEALRRLTERTEEEWRAAIGRWEGAKVVLLHASAEVLCRAVCGWAGVPLADADAAGRTAELEAIVDGAGSLGPRNWKGHVARRRLERWVEGVVAAVRSGRLEPGDETPLAVVARHRELDGSLLSEEVAAVELINLLRPTVAIAWYVAFAALALHEHPEAREAVVAGGEDEVERFVQEVRRLCPFFPAVGGRATEPFEWRGHRFEEGAWILLDLYGTDRDPRLWDRPEEFLPERFAGREPTPYDLIPQGGGDHAEHHRCAGEWVTIELTKVAVRALTRWMEYEVPPQDLTVRLSRLPARPESGFMLTGVRPTD